MKKQIKNTPRIVDYAILGLIQTKPLSGYRIRKAFEESALGNYSSSPGTIYPALKRMEKMALIEKVIRSDTSKSRFAITIEGKKALHSWLTQPLTMTDVEKKMDTIFLRFAFMDPMVKKDHKIIFLQSFSSLLKSCNKNLLEYHKQESSNMPLNGRLAFEHGIATNKTTLKWCKRAITEIINT